MAVSFMLSKEWFSEITSGEKRVEYRTIKPYWESRLDSAGQGSDIVFLCGQETVRGSVVSVEVVDTPNHVSEIVEGEQCFAITFTLESDS